MGGVGTLRYRFRSAKSVKSSSKALENVSSAMYLGVRRLVHKFKFQHTHINRISSNANQSLGFIKRNIKTKHTGVRQAAYKTIVFLQLQYASTVWTYPHKIEMVQRRAIRWTLNNYSSYDDASRMQTNLGWRSLEQRRADARLCHSTSIIIPTAK